VVEIGVREEHQAPPAVDHLPVRDLVQVHQVVHQAAEVDPLQIRRVVVAQVVAAHLVTEENLKDQRNQLQENQVKVDLLSNINLENL